MSVLHRGARSAPAITRALQRVFPSPTHGAAPTEVPGLGLSRATLVILAVLGLATLGKQVSIFTQPDLYRKDFRQEYLLGRAVLDGANPYQPEHELAAIYLPEAAHYVQPSLHPPFMVAVGVPFALLEYPEAAAAWLGLELVLLFALAMLIVQERLNARPTWRTALLFCVLLLWYPVGQELTWGQTGLLLAVLIAGCGLMLRAERRKPAGILLGAAIAIKLLPALLAGYLVLNRRARIAGVGAATVLLLTAIGTVAAGGDGLGRYLSSELSASPRFLAAEGNYAVYGAVLRLFTGSFTMQPLIDAPQIGGLIAGLLAGGVLLIAVRGALASGDSELAFAAVVAAMVVAGPLAWWHYQVLLIWPIAVVGRRLHARGWPARESSAVVLGTVLMAIPVNVYYGLAAGIAIAANMGAAAGLTPDHLGRTIPGIAGLPFVLEPLGPGLILLGAIWALRTPSLSGLGPLNP
jgi:alpha-1,2-mannosyltransferase